MGLLCLPMNGPTLTQASSTRTDILSAARPADPAMFCYQCQESFRNTGCHTRGVCGKSPATAALQDLLLYVLRGLAVPAEALRAAGCWNMRDAHVDFIVESLFSTITNANWDDHYFEARITEALERRDALRAETGMLGMDLGVLPPEVVWWAPVEAYGAKSKAIGILSHPDEDIRSLRELLRTVLKGIAAYAKHASALGHRDAAVDAFFLQALAAAAGDPGQDELLGWVMRAGEVSVTAMALLDRANTETYGHPEMTRINIGVGTRPGILVSGHDLRDLAELLEQSRDAGVDIYTHGEMLPAHSYPAFKKYPHFFGNYGNAWWLQNQEFEAFRGPILLTTNCLVPPKPENTYLDRLHTTGAVRLPGAAHIPDRRSGASKDFSALIAQAQLCPPPEALESGTVTGGFAHHQVLSLAGEILAAVRSGAIRRFVVMAGCDGRHTSRSYYTEVAQALPQDTVILTAGCAKFRYNKLPLGDIGGIPRVLDAGQCNDSYSLALVALRLKEALGLEDINDLPISYDIAWYEQKAVAVLLALLHLGVKGIRLGPTLPAFLSPNVARLLIERFGLKTIGTAEEDIADMLAS